MEDCIVASPIEEVERTLINLEGIPVIMAGEILENILPWQEETMACMGEEIPMVRPRWLEEIMAEIMEEIIPMELRIMEITVVELEVLVVELLEEIMVVELELMVAELLEEIMVELVKEELLLIIWQVSIFFLTNCCSLEWQESISSNITAWNKTQKKENLFSNKPNVLSHNYSLGLRKVAENIIWHIFVSRKAQ